MFTRTLVAALGSAGLLAVAATAPTWTATLEPQGDFRVTGTARVESAGKDSTRATISLSNAEAGATMPWYIHRGKCDAAGPITGPKTAYQPVKVGPSGSGSTTVTLPIATPETGEFAVQVHRSATDMKTTVACGELKPAPQTIPEKGSAR